MDGWINFSVIRYIQKDVGIEERVRRRRSSCYTSQNILSNRMFHTEVSLFISKHNLRAQFLRLYSRDLFLGLT